MHQRIRHACTVLVAAIALTGCDLSELSTLTDPPAGQAAETGFDASEDPAPAAGTLSGLYYRNYSYYGGYPTPSYNLVENYYYFTPDGRFYDGVPPGGLERFDWDRARRDEPENVGTYAIEGEKIVFTMADGKTRSMKFAPDEGRNVRLDGYLASLRGPFRETRLVGQYFNGAYAPGTSTGNLTTGRTLKLYADGTYEASNLATWGSDIVDQASAQGTYTLSGNTLKLTGDDGVVSYHTVFPFGDADDPADSPDIINVDGRSYVIEGGD